MRTQKSRHKTAPAMTGAITTQLEDLDNSADWSPAEWKQWLDGRLTRRREVYRHSPELMIAAFNRENGLSSDYHGRELLEMLQNADDACGAESGSGGRILFDLTEGGICIANSGKPFEKGGVESLMLPDYSPKLRSRARFIGNKGLGFRSVLNWSESPAILSGNLRLFFSRECADSWLRDLYVSSDKVRGEVDVARQEGGAWPVAMLDVPACEPYDPRKAGGSEDAPTVEAAKRDTFTRAEYLRREGYDTVIALPLAGPAALTEALKQVSELGPDLLLFARHLRELAVVIRSENSGEVRNVWQIDRAFDGEAGEVTITGTGVDAPRRWNIYGRSGVLPAEYVTSDLVQTPGYELRLAVPENATPLSGFLYNHFPTLVRFPYPVVAHATMDLIGNRQQIRDSAANRHIARELARFLARVAAERFARADTPWRALNLLSPAVGAGAVDTQLHNMGFEDELYAAAATQPIVPVKDGSFRTASAALRLKVQDDAYTHRPIEPGDWLPVREFDDIVAPLGSGDTADALRKTLTRLDIEFLTNSEFRERLNTLSPALSPEDRAKLIAGLLQTRSTPDPPPYLLTDENGAVIKPAASRSTYRVFLPPAGGRRFDLPAWSDIRLLNAELAATLQDKLNVRGRNHLVSLLSVYSIQEYEFGALATSLRSQADIHAAKDPALGRSYRDETVRAIYNYFRAATGTLLPPDLYLWIPNRIGQSGQYVRAETLCFGDGYQNGILPEALYGIAAPDRLVARPDLLPIGGEPGEIIAFLRWLGVSDLPHTVIEPEVQDDFRTYVENQFHYPVELDDNSEPIVALTNASLQARWVANVATLPDLAGVLKYADPHAILAWLALDTARFDIWRRDGDARAEYRLRRPYQSRDRTIVRQTAIPSRILWEIGRNEWLPIDAETRRCPGDCLFSSNLPVALRSLLPFPRIDLQHPLFQKLRLDGASIRRALEIAGARPGLDSLSWPEVYDLLLDLPSRDPDGECAPAVYRELLKRDTDAIPESPERKRFLKSGLIYGTHGGEKSYYPRVGLYFSANTALPMQVVRAARLAAFPRIDIPGKVERLFGIGQITSDRVRLEITGYEPAPGQETLQRRIEALKPYTLALRNATDSERRGWPRLRGLQVTGCLSIVGTVHFEDTSSDFEMTASGEFIAATMGEDSDAADRAYLVCSTGSTSLADPFLGRSLDSLFSSLLDVEPRGNVAQLAACPARERPRMLELLIGPVSGEKSTESLLRDARAYLGSTEDPIDDWDPFHSTPSPGPSDPPLPPPPSLPVGEPDDANSGGVAGDGDSNDVDTGPASTHSPAAVSSQEKERESRRLRGEIERAVRKHQVREGKHPSRRSVPASSERSQQLARLFESEQGRFPRQVDHVTGNQGYGCDILSFATEDDRELFEQTRNNGLVARFIEVKGRSDETGPVELTDNEWRAADTHHERFYLYRVYKTETAGEFEIAILADPASAEHIRVVRIIDPFVESSTCYWTVSEEPA